MRTILPNAMTIAPITQSSIKCFLSKKSFLFTTDVLTSYGEICDVINLLYLICYWWYIVATCRRIIQRIFAQTPKIKSSKLIMLQTWPLGSHETTKNTLPHYEWGKYDFCTHPFLTVGIFGQKLKFSNFHHMSHDYTL